MVLMSVAKIYRKSSLLGESERLGLNLGVEDLDRLPTERRSAIVGPYAELVGLVIDEDANDFELHGAGKDDTIL
jgi:hypothetical protein